MCSMWLHGWTGIKYPVILNRKRFQGDLWMVKKRF